jgi:hypothetical protein
MAIIREMERWFAMKDDELHSAVEYVIRQSLKADFEEVNKLPSGYIVMSDGLVKSERDQAVRLWHKEQKIKLNWRQFGMVVVTMYEKYNDALAFYLTFGQ